MSNGYVIGAKVRTMHCGHEKIGTIEKVGRTRVTVRVPLLTGGSKTVTRNIAGTRGVRSLSGAGLSYLYDECELVEVTQ